MSELDPAPGGRREAESRSQAAKAALAARIDRLQACFDECREEVELTVQLRHSRPGPADDDGADRERATSTPPDARSLAARFRLAERGRERGKRNQPPSDQPDPDRVETEVISACDKNFIDQRDAYSKRRRLLQEQIAAVEDPGADGGMVAREACRALEDGLAKELPELEAAARDAQKSVDEVRDFKRAHALDREARVAANSTWSWGILLAMVLGETLVNGLFFGANMAGGLFGGTSYAVLISVINVLVFGGIAAAAVRWISHRDPLRRVTGVAGLAAIALVAVVWNLLVAHYREALADDYPPEPAPAVVAAAPAASQGDQQRAAAAQCWQGDTEAAADGEAVCLLLSQWFSLHGFQSYMLLLIGMAMCAGAAVKLWGMTDPYPEYGAKEKARRLAEARLHEQRSELLERLRTDFAEAMARQRSMFVDPRDLWMRRKRAAAELRERYAVLRDFADGLERACARALYIYRTENRAARTDAVPKAWSEPWQAAWKVPEPPRIEPPESPEDADRRRGDARAALAAGEKKLEDCVKECEKRVEQIARLDYE